MHQVTSVGVCEEGRYIYELWIVKDKWCNKINWGDRIKTQLIYHWHGGLLGESYCEVYVQFLPERHSIYLYREMCF